MTLTMVPGIALFFYTILFLALTAAKKNKLIYIFQIMIFFFILWTAGSVMMRSNMFPSVIFWCKVSIFGMFGIPMLYYEFICTFVNDKGYFRKYIFLILFIICELLLLSDFLIQQPQLVEIDGMRTFSFEPTIWISIPIIYVLFVAITVLQKIVKSIFQKGSQLQDFLPLIAGICILTLGTLASTIPAIGKYPIDTCSGIINAICLFYILYNKRLIKMTLVISRGTAYVLTCAVVLLFSMNFIQPIESFLDHVFPFLNGYNTTLVVLLFSLITSVVFFSIKRFIDLLFVKEDQKKANLLRSYSSCIASYLDLKEICKELVSVVKEDIEGVNVYLCLLNEEEHSYEMVYSSNTLNRQVLNISIQNPCVVFLKQTKKSVSLRTFQRSVWYKSMWEKEKRVFNDLHIDCFVPLIVENELIGMIVLSQKPKPYTLNDLIFLDSVASISAIAIKNAYLYQSVYEKASSDHLTGLLNREFFFQELEKKFLEENETIALAILNIDDFSLYNELYGRDQADIALQQIASVLESSWKDENSVIARYSGKEFAILCTNMDIIKVKRMLQMVIDQMQKQIDMNQGKWKRVLTFSIGICIYPYAAENEKELISNTEMAVFTAKQNGKNRMVVYTMEEIVQNNTKVNEDTRQVYAQYAPTISALTAAIDMKDRYTFQHSANVSQYAMILAQAYGLNAEHVELIREAALLHDIGKIGIPEDILNKPGKLTDDEYRMIQTHVEKSISIIRHLPSLDYVIPAVLGHHERWDGKGYPRGLKRDENPIAARCICIADTFDAMTTKRSYRDPLPLEIAVEEIKKGANTQFDPKLANLFVELIQNGSITIL